MGVEQHFDEEAGKVPPQPDWAGLEVVHDNGDKVVLPRAEEAPQLRYDGTAPEVPIDQFSKDGRSSTLHDPASPVEVEANEWKPGFWRRRRHIIAVVVVIIVIVVGAVVGGVLGAKYSRSDSSDPEENTRPSTPSPTSSPVPTSIAYRSALAVAAYQDDGDESWNIYLAYQAPDRTLKFTSRRVDGDGDQSWGTSQSTSSNSEPRNLTSLAMTIVYVDEAVQFEMLYVNSSNQLAGVNLNTGAASASGFKQDSINDEAFTTFPKGNIGAYGPWVLYRNVQGRLHTSWRNKTTGSWSPQGTDIQVLDGTKLAVVPLTTNYTLTDANATIGVFFQDEQGKLMARANPTDGKTPPPPPEDDDGDWCPCWRAECRNNADRPCNGPPEGVIGRPGGPDKRRHWGRLHRRQAAESSWPSEFPDITISTGNSFAAFSVPRLNDEDNNLVNTYLLYQDDNFDIKQVWTDDGREWQQSSPDALKGADEGTSIACITPPMWQSQANSLDLRQAPSMMRCYYQRDGAVVEARFDGGEWVEVGEVSL